MKHNKYEQNSKIVYGVCNTSLYIIEHTSSEYSPESRTIKKFNIRKNVVDYNFVDINTVLLLSDP